MKPLERFKQTGRILRIESGAIVPHEIYGLTMAFASAKFNLRMRAA
jgi:hypothetical protein